MTVHELMELLEKCNPEVEVFMDECGWRVPIVDLERAKDESIILLSEV